MTVQVRVGISEDLDDKIEHLLERLEAQSAGLPVSRSTVVRTALQRGLEAMMEELDKNDDDSIQLGRDDAALISESERTANFKSALSARLGPVKQGVRCEWSSFPPQWELVVDGVLVVVEVDVATSENRCSEAVLQRSIGAALRQAIAGPSEVRQFEGFRSRLEMRLPGVRVDSVEWVRTSQAWAVLVRRIDRLGDHAIEVCIANLLRRPEAMGDRFSDAALHAVIRGVSRRLKEV